MEFARAQQYVMPIAQTVQAVLAAWSLWFSCLHFRLEEGGYLGSTGLELPNGPDGLQFCSSSPTICICSSGVPQPGG